MESTPYSQFDMGRLVTQGLVPRRHKLKPEQVDKLVDTLLECPTMRNLNRRNSIIDTLPPKIKNLIVIGNAPRDDVLSIITTCLDFPGGIEFLIERLKRREGSSFAMQDIIELVEKLGITLNITI